MESDQRTNQTAAISVTGRAADRSIPAPPVVVWILEHEYTDAGISWADLKGRDGRLAKVLQRYNNCSIIPIDHRFQLRVQLIKRVESGSGDPFDDYDPYDEENWDAEGDA
jgi:hypothetical protein